RDLSTNEFAARARLHCRRTACMHPWSGRDGHCVVPSTPASCRPCGGGADHVSNQAHGLVQNRSGGRGSFGRARGANALPDGSGAVFGECAVSASTRLRVTTGASPGTGTSDRGRVESIRLAGPGSVKDEVVHTHAPASRSERMVTLRSHLDETPSENGALRVIPGSH